MSVLFIEKKTNKSNAVFVKQTHGNNFIGLF
jgi:hypothetical protein